MDLSDCCLYLKLPSVISIHGAPLHVVGKLRLTLIKSASWEPSIQTPDCRGRCVSVEEIKLCMYYHLENQLELHRYTDIYRYTSRHYFLIRFYTSRIIGSKMSLSVRYQWVSFSSSWDKLMLVWLLNYGIIIISPCPNCMHWQVI